MCFKFKGLSVFVLTKGEVVVDGRGEGVDGLTKKKRFGTEKCGIAGVIKYAKKAIQALIV